MNDTPEDDRTVIRPAVRVPPLPAAATTATARPDDGANGLPIGTRMGELEITQLLGEGGFGIVYLCTDHALQRQVAVKEYMPSSLAARTAERGVVVKSERHRETFQAGLSSFINEARLLASFDHPALVKVYRFWEANGTAYMVMPFYEGGTLKDALRALPGPPDEAWLRTRLSPLIEALAVIHAQQCYHRDIAPDNVILLASTGRPLLLDFGAARRVIGDMTQALTVILKPGYAPLEQYAEIPGMKQGPWTDVYALAAVVYFAITGRTPPPSVGRMVNDTYVPLLQSAQGRYSAEFLAAIDHALAVRPEARTQSIEQLRDELGLFGAAARPGASASPVAAASSRGERAGGANAHAGSPAPARQPLGGAAKAGIAVALLAVIGGAAAWLALSGGAAPRGQAASALPGVGVSDAAGVAPIPSPSPAPAAATDAGTVAGAVSGAVAVRAAGAPPTPAAAPAGLDGVAEFERLVAAQTPGWGLAVQPTQGSFRIGRDDIGLSVQAEREGYLYVFAHASDGTLAQVVPNTVSGSVRLKKGQRWRFPGGDGVVLEAAEPAGPVQLLVLLSDRQRDHGALEPQKLGAMRLFPTGAAAAAVVARHAGPQPLLAGRALCPPSGACDTGFGAALVRVGVVR